MMKKQAYIRVYTILLLFIPIICGCGGSNYKYSSVKSKAEEQLKKKRYKKAEKLFSLIYKKEKERKNKEMKRILWAYYRLGVINELKGKSRLAKGFYWGDQMKQGFYSDSSSINFYAKAGWKHLDDGRAPRKLPEILALEKKSAPKTTAKNTKKKFKRSYKRYSRSKKRTNSKQTRSFSGSLTPPRHGTAEPFRVFY
jgi:hypothetical protein